MSDLYTIATSNVVKPNTKGEDLLQVLKYRYATKQFDPNKQISKEDFNLLLEAAQLSPTSFGLETWKMIVIEDKEVRQALKEHAWGAQNALDNASHFVVFLANKKGTLTFGSDYINHMLKEVHQVPEEVYQFYSQAYANFATHTFKTLESDRSAFDWAAKQAYIVMANMMTMAAYIGIDSCAVEGFIPKEFNSILGEKFGLFDTKDYGVAVCVAFGYRNEEPHRDKTRRPLKESIIWK